MAETKDETMKLDVINWKEENVKFDKNNMKYAIFMLMVFYYFYFINTIQTLI